MTRPSRKTKRATDPLTTVAREIDLPIEQRHDIVLTDVVNFTDADQRHMMRDGAEGERKRGSAVGEKARQTVRKLTRIERLVKLGIIDKDQAHACQWYAEQAEIGWAVKGCCANYGGVGGGSGDFDHSSRSVSQSDARANYRFARQAIPAELVVLFEDVIIADRLGENEFRAVTRNEVLRIGIAAWMLHGQVSHLIAISA